MTNTLTINDVVRDTIYGVVAALQAGDLDTAESGLNAVNEMLQR